MDTIQCPHCKSEGVPHLWHYQPLGGVLRYMKTQHMCRICGRVMYVTGGQISWVGYAVFIMIFALAFEIVRAAVPNWWFWKMLDPLGGLALFGFIGYKIYRRVVNKSE